MALSQLRHRGHAAGPAPLVLPTLHHDVAACNSPCPAMAVPADGAEGPTNASNAIVGSAGESVRVLMVAHGAPTRYVWSMVGDIAEPAAGIESGSSENTRPRGQEGRRVEALVERHRRYTTGSKYSVLLLYS